MTSFSVDSDIAKNIPNTISLRGYWHQYRNIERQYFSVDTVIATKIIDTDIATKYLSVDIDGSAAGCFPQVARSGPDASD